ncbi:zinc ribbon domain-containing protein [Aliinostoc sp. HNIBRCY26]|uniref:zinc ribbon domain-containing protein n=1 Tax=Aliinostoc sp. HNIBRCY26 TaxID=3418997 RepID=UPI003D0822EA
MEYIIVLLFTGVITALIAQGKNRRALVWFLCGFVVVGLFIIPFLSSLRKCPNCGKAIERETKICGYCGHNML